MLSVVFLVEFGVMYGLLPLILPEDTPGGLEALLDACLLTVIVSPVFWFVIVRPLRESAAGESARAASIITTAADGIMTVDQDDRIQSFNPAAESIFGRSADSVVDGPVAAILSSSEFDSFSEIIESNQGLPMSMLQQTAIEVEGLRPDGSRVPLMLSLSAFRMGLERFVTAIVRDLTTEKQAQAEIRSRVEQQAVVAELGQRALAGSELPALMNDVARVTQTTLAWNVCLVVRFDPDSESLFLVGTSEETKRSFEISQLTLQAVECDQWRAMLDAASRTFEFTSLEQLHSQTLSLELERHGVVCGIATLIAGSGSPFGLLVGGCSSRTTRTSADRSFFQSAAHIAATAISRERIERERHEKETLRAEQMSVIAQIATGVAHEIRNPLTSIKMLVQMHREWLEKRAASTEDFDVIESEIRRMEQSLNTFLAYARPSRAEQRPVPLQELLQRTARLIEGRCMRQSVALSIGELPAHDDAELLTINADPAQIQQLLLNLSLNALDAMHSGGRLEISAKIDIHQFVEISVQDTGPGVPAELQFRIFEPFFTTKETGVGMGLMICRRIAEDHGGQLLLRPSNKGACFVVRLPILSGCHE